MKNNKLIIYTGLIIAGIALGWLFFGGSSNEVAKHDLETAPETSQVWTCTMHPQIRLEDKGDCPICGMELLPANQLEASIDPDAIRMSKTARALAKVETMVVGSSESTTNSQSFSGQLAINQNLVKNITANYKARVEKLYINEVGEQIKKGQVIAELYSPDIQVLKDEYRLAQKSGNSSLINSINQKIKNLELSVTEIQSMENGILKLKSPISGTIEDILINQGDNISANQKLLQIANLSSLWSNLDVYESTLNSLKVGDKMNILIPNQNDIIGEVTFISPVLNDNTRSATARVVIDNKQRELKPGVFISAKLENESKDQSDEETLMLPKSAMLWTGQRSVVYQELEDDKGLSYKMKEVTTGQTFSDAIEISSGISDGDVIVTQGAFSIDSEAQLVDKPSMMNPKTLTSTEPQAELQIDNTYLKYYFDLKNALVNDYFEKAKSINTDFMSFVNSKSSNQGNFENLKNLLRQMKNTSTIDDFRDIFIQLSNEIIELSKSFGVDQKIYVQFCPMANSNEGAYWLSLNENIKNPYYGQSMLKCGEVREVIKAPSNSP